MTLIVTYQKWLRFAAAGLRTGNMPVLNIGLPGLRACSRRGEDTATTLIVFLAASGGGVNTQPARQCPCSTAGMKASRAVRVAATVPNSSDESPLLVAIVRVRGCVTARRSACPAQFGIRHKFGEHGPLDKLANAVHTHVDTRVTAVFVRSKLTSSLTIAVQ
jgi:hypothetical protein